jgi:membrane associated rhomboid family serine protease
MFPGCFQIPLFEDALAFFARYAYPVKNNGEPTMIPLRDENPTRLTPYVTWAIVGINVLCFLGQLLGNLNGAMMVPAEITKGIEVDTNGVSLHPFWVTIFTSMFLHGGIMHLAGNMVYLIIFGNNIEEALGRVKYIIFYLLCGIAAAASQILYGPDSIVPVLGASGAIAGVLGGYLMLFPKASVITLIPVVFTTIRLPAWVLLGFWIVSQFFSQYLGSTQNHGKETGGVAYLAHIGGFIAGLILVKLLGGKTMPCPDNYPNENNGTPDRRRYYYKQW